MHLFKNTALAAAIGFITVFSSSAGATEASAEMFRNYAYSGSFEEGAIALLNVSAADPGDAEARFGAGALQFFGAVKHLQQSLYLYGAGNALAAQNNRGMLRRVVPILRLPVPPNSNPEVISYKIVRQIFATFVSDLDQARTTLSSVGDVPVRLEINPLKIAVDLDQDGAISKNESILGAYLSMGRRRTTVSEEDRASADTFSVVFDTADVSWLQGYSNALMAAGKFFLAFDFEQTYDASFHALFGNQSTRFGQFLSTMQPTKERAAELMVELKALQEERSQIKVSSENRAKQNELRKQLCFVEKAKENNAKRKEIRKQIRALELTLEQRNRRNQLRAQIRAKQAEMAGRNKASYDDIFEVVALLHTLNWDVVSPQDLADVRLHLLEVMRLNHVTWKSVMAETDNDHEWLPNAKQDGPFPDLKISQDNIDSWLRVVGFAEDVLEGRKLIPHARFPRGLNLKRFFETAKSFDLVMFIAGPGAVDYLEKDGEIVSERTWRAITQPFNRNFGLFVVWFN